MLPDPPKRSIETYLANEGLLEDIIAQLQKDLGPTYDLGHDLIELPFEDVLKRLADILAALDKKDQLRSTLYRIDLKEGPWHDYKHLAKQILDREFKKVWYRKWHSHFSS